jgi:hypothetical protein
MIHVAVRDVELVRRAVDDDVRRRAEVRGVVAAFALPGLPDLHQELPVARELQDLRVFSPPAPEPNVVFVVDVDAMLELRPVISRAWSAPRRDERPVRIELEHRRRRFPDRSRFVRLQRRRTMRHPHVIARIDRHASDGAEDPPVGQRFGQNGSTRNVGTWRDMLVGFCANGTAPDVSNAAKTKMADRRRWRCIS